MIPWVQRLFIKRNDEDQARPVVIIDVILGSSWSRRSLPGDVLATGQVMGGSLAFPVFPDVDNCSRCGSLESWSLGNICQASVTY